MKALPWFRAYTEMMDDEKLRLLAFEDRWHFVAILCMKGAGILDESGHLLMRKAAVKMGLAVRELEEVARRLSEVGLIDAATLQPLAWDARQMKSDSSAERVQAFRERQKQTKRGCNVTVTAQETDTDTDKEQEKTVKTAPIGFTPPNWINLQHWQAWHSSPKRKKATNDQKQMAVDKLDAWRQNGEDFAGALENAAVGGYQGLFLPDKKHGSSGETAYQRSMREKMEVMAPAIAAKAPGVPRTNPNNFFDALPNAKPLEIAQ